MQDITEITPKLTHGINIYISILIHAMYQKCLEKGAGKMYISAVIFTTA